MKRLKLNPIEKSLLLKYGYVEIVRGIFTIVITVNDYGDYFISVLNPYDTERLEEDMKREEKKQTNQLTNQPTKKDKFSDE